MFLNRRALLRTGLVTTAMVPLVGGTTGCATLLELLGELVDVPEMSLKSFKVTKTTLSSFSVNIVALMKNPNPFGFKIDGLDWGVKLAGNAVAKGRTNKALQLKAKGTSETDLDIDFDIAKTAAAVLDMLDKKSVLLGIDAVAHLRANKYKFDIPGEFETKLPMPQVPAFDVPRFAVERLTTAGVTFSVEPLVTNNNPFDIAIDAFDFNIKITGREVLRNKTIRNLKIGSKKRERVPFEFAVDFADIGMTAARIATSPRVDWEVAANLTSGILKVPFKQGGRVSLS